MTRSGQNSTTPTMPSYCGRGFSGSGAVVELFFGNVFISGYAFAVFTLCIGLTLQIGRISWCTGRDSTNTVGFARSVGVKARSHNRAPGAVHHGMPAVIRDAGSRPEAAPVLDTGVCFAHGIR